MRCNVEYRDKAFEKDRSYFRPVGGRMLEKSVLKHVKRRPEGIWEGAAVGFDAAAFQGKEEMILQASGAATTGWFPDGASVTAEEAAFLIAENQMAAGGAVPFTMQIFLTMGKDYPEEKLRSLMQHLSTLATEKKCSVAGGNTVYFGEGEDCLVQILMTGAPEKYDRYVNHSKERPGKPGDSVYFVGEVGSLGAELLTAAYNERLKEHFSESYLREMHYSKEAFSIRSRAEQSYGAGAVFLHDVSYGGVYTALYQLAEAAGTGISVRHEGLRIRQSVIELSETLKISPYLLLGTGAFLAVVPTDREEDWKDRMTEAGIPVSFAATLTKEKARVVRADHFSMERYLNLPDGDALTEACFTKGWDDLG